MKLGSLIFLTQAFKALGFGVRVPSMHFGATSSSAIKATSDLPTPQPASPENVIILEDADAVGT
jgi:hypothetical protein